MNIYLTRTSVKSAFVRTQNRHFEYIKVPYKNAQTAWERARARTHIHTHTHTHTYIYTYIYIYIYIENELFLSTAVQRRQHVDAVGPHVSFSGLVIVFVCDILKILVGASKFVMGILRPLAPPCLGPSLNHLFPYFSQFVIHKYHHSEGHNILNTIL